MKEKKYIVSLEKGYAQVETDKIEGEMDSIIIIFPGQGEITIMSELGYDIFHSREIRDTEYYPIRIQPLDKYGHRINFQADKFLLNEKLIIELRTYYMRYAFFGRKEKNEVTIIIRYGWPTIN